MTSMIDAHLKPPLTYRDCFTLGKIDMPKFLSYRCKCEALEEDISAINKIISSSMKSKKRGRDENIKAARNQLRSVKRYKLHVQNDDGTLREL